MYILTYILTSQPALIKLDNENIGGHRYTFTPVLSDLLSALYAGNIPMLTMLDLSAAFDSVDHNTFLRRLWKSYGLGRERHRLTLLTG